MWRARLNQNNPATALVKNGCICCLYFALYIVIVVVGAGLVIGTTTVVRQITTKEKDIVPFRTVQHGIWPGYAHEFFDEYVSYLKAETICASRNGSVLHFNSKEQESNFDRYVSSFFWNEVQYPKFQLWTSGIILTKQLTAGNKVIWPEPNAKGELQKIRECAVRGEGIVNAFGTSSMYWQERHIIKDYIAKNQPENAMDEQTGCWQHIKRNDIAPERLYRFVCQKKISA